MGVVARYKPGESVPAFTKTAVTAGRFVAIVDDKTDQGDYQVGHATAGERAFGVAETSGNATDAPTSHRRRVNVTRRGAIARVEVGTGGVNAGDEVEVGANGTAIAATSGEVVGIACADADNGEIGEVDLI